MTQQDPVAAKTAPMKPRSVRWSGMSQSGALPAIQANVGLSSAPSTLSLKRFTAIRAVPWDSPVEGADYGRSCPHLKSL